MRTAKKQSSTLVTMQEDSGSDSDYWDDELPPLHPDRRCIEFENAWYDEACWAQWDDWDDYCDYIDWNDQCEAVDRAWFDQDLDWQYPPALRPECISMQPDAECQAEFDKIRDMCNTEGDYEAVPVMWTQTCDAVEALEWAAEEVWASWEEDGGLDMVALKQRHAVLTKKHAMREAKNAARYSLSLIGKTAAAE